MINSKRDDILFLEKDEHPSFNDDNSDADTISPIYCTHL